MTDEAVNVISQESENVAESNEQAVTANLVDESKRWQWSDGVYGEGEKPDWFQSRYKNVAEQAKAYSELEKKFGEFKGAPKDGYKFDEVGLNKDDPLLQHFSKTFSELNLSQQGFNRIISEFVEFEKSASEKKIQEEMSKLGPDAKQQLEQVTTWASNTFNDEVSSTINDWLVTKNDVVALQAIIAAMSGTRVPTGQGLESISAPTETKDEVINEKVKNWKRFQEDVNYRNSITKRLGDAIRREESMKKM